MELLSLTENVLYLAWSQIDRKLIEPPDFLTSLVWSLVDGLGGLDLSITIIPLHVFWYTYVHANRKIYKLYTYTHMSWNTDIICMYNILMLSTLFRCTEIMFGILLSVGHTVCTR